VPEYRFRMTDWRAYTLLDGKRRTVEFDSAKLHGVNLEANLVQQLSK
jgi:hypothetical protein